MAILLFPGRHLVHTRFQEGYLAGVLRVAVERLAVVGPRRCGGEIEEVIFAVTSANQAHSRYNPIPLEARVVGVDRFARGLREAFSVVCRIVPVPHYGMTERFGEFLIKEIGEATEGERILTPENCVVLSSTPEVVEQFVKMGFGVLLAELELESRMGRRDVASLVAGQVVEGDGWVKVLGERAGFVSETPIEVVRGAVKAGENWFGDEGVRQKLSAASLSVWRDFPEVFKRVVRLYRDPLLTEQGSLTEMRNYSTYAVGMGHQAILEAKYNDIKGAIVAGRIADEGCADGALLVPIARDFRDSDLMGIEITGEFLDRCLERQRAMEFGGTYVHFHQRNITEPIFEPESIDTTICNSTTHELWSYGEQEKTVRAYLREKFRQTRKGGRLVIRDVVGQEEGERDVLLWCNAKDGKNPVIRGDEPNRGPELQAFLESMSTRARFHAFQAWYLFDQVAKGRRPESHKLVIREEKVDGEKYFVLPVHQAMEFLLKKDYTDNWASEMNEEFCFWSFSRWKREVSEAGFRVVEDPNHVERGSRAYSSEWIVKNRFEGKVKLFWREGMKRAEWPVTNMVLVGEK